jgi:hypothetical protein
MPTRRVASCYVHDLAASCMEHRSAPQAVPRPGVRNTLGHALPYKEEGRILRRGWGSTGSLLRLWGGALLQGVGSLLPGEIMRAVPGVAPVGHSAHRPHESLLPMTLSTL